MVCAPRLAHGKRRQGSCRSCEPARQQGAPAAIARQKVGASPLYRLRCHVTDPLSMTLTMRTIHNMPTYVNRLLPVTTRGQRMRSYLAARTGGRRGWQRALVESSGVQRQTITKWTHPDYDGYPDLDSLAAVASALGVRPWEVVAAMDGDDVQLEPGLETAIRRVVEQVLDERPELRAGNRE